MKPSSFLSELFAMIIMMVSIICFYWCICSAKKTDRHPIRVETIESSRP